MNDDWERRRDDPAAAWNRPRSGRGKKDRRRWCRGKAGVEHVTAIKSDGWYGRACRAYRVGKWERYETHKKWVYVGVDWACVHVEQCVNCGKKLRHLSAAECPIRPAVLPQAADFVQ